MFVSPAATTRAASRSKACRFRQISATLLITGQLAGNAIAETVRRSVPPPAALATGSGTILDAYSNGPLAQALKSQEGDEIDGYDLWRRIALDVCQRLPTIAEIACIEGNGGEIPTGLSLRTWSYGDQSGTCPSFISTLSKCLNSEAFAEKVATWAGTDFTEPNDSVAAGAFIRRYVVDSTDTGNGVLKMDGERLVYFGRYMDDSGVSDAGNCLRTDVLGDYRYTPTGAATQTLAALLSAGDLDVSAAWIEANLPLKKIRTAFWNNSYHQTAAPDFTESNLQAYNYRSSGLFSDDDGYYVWGCKTRFDDGVKNPICEQVDGVWTRSADQEVDLDDSTADLNRCSVGDDGSLSRSDAVNCSTEADLACGCGEGLGECRLRNALYLTPRTGTNSAGVETTILAGYSTDGDQYGRYRVGWQRDVEPFMFVKHLLMGTDGLFGENRPFTDLFTSSCVIRTSRAQHAQDAIRRWVSYQNGWDPRCLNRTAGTQGDVSAADCGGMAPPDDDVVFRDDYPGDVGTYGGEADWQKVCFDSPLEAHLPAGLLTNYALMISNPTEPNYANRVYSYWLCDTINWKHGVSYWHVDYIEGGGSPWEMRVPNGQEACGDGTNTDCVSFSKLHDTDAANEALGKDDCKGCHGIVNSMGAFKNRWTQGGAYLPNRTSPQGVFQAQNAEDIPALGALMAESPVVHACIANRVAFDLTHRFLDRDSSSLQTLVDKFQGDRDIRDVYKAMLALPEYRRAR
ncbi:MAG: hypothetical protein H6981_14550 [Gammaproteobacteria bacterium]|nr:hypothetical protein [Gammaproteobacteria bacterium]MCP5138004.1 hypothetical protein [Gammaproteobacteria bacterium]